MKVNLDILSCPICKSHLISRKNLIICSNNECFYSKIPFSTINDKLILVDFENSVVQLDPLLKNNASSLVRRTVVFSKVKSIAKNMLHGSTNDQKINFESCAQLIDKVINPKILIIGGGTIGRACEIIIEKFKDSIISFDVYDSENIDFIADAHSIPLKDNSVDLIIIQAVLEHVLVPSTVVSECHRVLKEGAYIYSETPFLQDVHEGAYDYTRYTVLGHRILFKEFKEIKSGYIGGLGQSLLWSIDYFARGLFRSRLVGKFVKACFLWVRLLEKLIPETWNNDGACCCFFLGQKEVSPAKIKWIDFISGYKGVQK